MINIMQQQLLKKDKVAANTEQDSACIFSVPNVKAERRHRCQETLPACHGRTAGRKVKTKNRVNVKYAITERTEGTVGS